MPKVAAAKPVEPVVQPDPAVVIPDSEQAPAAAAEAAAAAAAEAAAVAKAAAPDPFGDAWDKFSQPEPDPDAPVIIRAQEPAKPAVQESAKPTIPAKSADGSLPDPEAVAAAAAAAATKTSEQKAAEDVAAAEAATATAAAEELAEKPTDQELLQRFTDILADKIKPAAPAKPSVVTEPEVAPYSDEEKAALEKYHTEFPEVARAEELKRSREYERLVHYVFSQVGPALTQLREQVEAVGTQAHEKAVYALVPDYDTIYPAVTAWMDKQPDYMRAAYQVVAERGTPEQINDLINRFRVETKTPAPEATKAAAKVIPSAVPTVRAAAQPDPKVAAAAAALAPTPSKRSGVSTDGVDPSNFDQSFEFFAELEAERERKAQLRG